MHLLIPMMMPDIRRVKLTFVSVNASSNTWYFFKCLLARIKHIIKNVLKVLPICELKEYYFTGSTDKWREAGVDSVS